MNYINELEQLTKKIQQAQSTKVSYLTSATTLQKFPIINEFCKNNDIAIEILPQSVDTQQLNNNSDIIYIIPTNNQHFIKIITEE